jgi:hypothetical protein
MRPYLLLILVLTFNLLAFSQNKSRSPRSAATKKSNLSNIYIDAKSLNISERKAIWDFLKILDSSDVIFTNSNDLDDLKKFQQTVKRASNLLKEDSIHNGVIKIAAYQLMQAYTDSTILFLLGYIRESSGRIVLSQSEAEYLGEMRRQYSSSLKFEPTADLLDGKNIAKIYGQAMGLKERLYFILEETK